MISGRGVAGDTEFSPELEAKFDEIWENFRDLNSQTSEQMDQFLTRLLALPAEATSWSDLLHRFARSNHRVFAGVFRRISKAVPHIKSSGLAFFYWAAAEEFVRLGLTQFLLEVAAGFRKLDLHSYDADALARAEDYLLAAGFEAETLQLAEHFLAIERADNGLMPHAVPEQCNLIFELRVGQAIPRVASEKAEMRTTNRGHRSGIDLAESGH